MIKDNQKMLNKVHILMDAVIVVITYLFSYYLRFKSPLINIPLFKVVKGEYYPIEVYSQPLIYVVPLYLLIYYYSRLYTPKRGKLKWTEVYNLIIANSFGIVFSTSILYFSKEINISRFFFGFFFVSNVLLCSGARQLLFYSLRVARRKGYNLKHVILVGYSRAAEAYIDRIFSNPQWGYNRE